MVELDRLGLPSIQPPHDLADPWPEKCTCKRRVDDPNFVIVCEEHGGLWSYKCGACREHSKRDEDWVLAIGKPWQE